MAESLPGRQHVARRAVGNDAAAVDERQAVGEAGGGAEVVHGGDHRDPVATAKFVDQLQNGAAVSQVESARRLVEQQDRSLLGERAREHDALGLAAGQLRDRSLCETPQVETFQDRGHDPAVPARLDRQPAKMWTSTQQGVLGNGHALGEERDLRHQRHVDARRPPATGEGHRAVVVDQPGDGPQQGGLAGTVGSDQAEPLALREV